MIHLVNTIEKLVQNRVVAALPLACWCITVFTLSSIPGGYYPKVDIPHSDKWVHFLLYFCGGLCAALAFCRSEKPMIYAIVFGTAFGLSDEFHQLFVPMRSFSLIDWAADIIGITAATITFYLYVSKFHLPWIHSRGEASIIRNSQRMEPV